MSGLDKVMELFPQHAKEMREREQLEARLCESIRQNCANALEEIATAIRHPRISRMDLEAATLSVAKALATANIIDPKDAA